MKTIEVSRVRWERFKKSLIALGKCKFDLQLPNQYAYDDFEQLEMIFNLVTEELRARLLHLAFVKPTEFKKLHKKYLFGLRKNWIIQKVCDAFLEDYGFSSQQLKRTSFLELIDRDHREDFLEQFQALSNGSTTSTPSIHLLNKHFIFNYFEMDNGKQIYIQLFEFIDSQKEIKKGLNKPLKSKMNNRRRDYILIEEIKNYIDRAPYTERISISQISKNFGINRTKMKQLFKEQYHYSIYQYFIHLRMTHAYLLVQTTTLQFKEIAYMVGYKDYSTFVKYFYRTYNKLPKEIRGQGSEGRNQNTVS